MEHSDTIMTHGVTFAEVFQGIDIGPFFGSITGIFLAALFPLMIYIFYSYCQYTLSEKLNIENSWMAWIPFLGTFNLVKIAGKSYWWIVWILLGYIFFYIPGIILTIIVLHGISTRTHHGGWWTVGLFFLWFVLFPITAFTYSNSTESDFSEEHLYPIN